MHLSPNASGGVASNVRVSNVSLVVHSVGRQSIGDYTCKADNSEGTGSSRPFHLDVKCKYSSKHIEIAAPHYFYVLLIIVEN